MIITDVLLSHSKSPKLEIHIYTKAVFRSHIIITFSFCEDLLNMLVTTQSPSVIILIILQIIVSYLTIKNRDALILGLN